MKYTPQFEHNLFDLARFICFKHLTPDTPNKLTLRQIFTFAQLNNWYNMSDEEREAEQIQARMEASKDKPITRLDLIEAFGNSASENQLKH